MAQITLTIRGDATQAQQVIEQLKSGLKSISNLQIDTSAVRSLETELQNAGKNAEAAAVQTTGAMNKQTSAVQGSGSALRDYSGAAGEAAKQTSILDNALKFTQWYFISGAVSAATRSIKEAVSEMKNVDDELVVIRKVTGETGAELEKIKDQSYRTGSTYGEAASEYLESVAAFARAGYKDLSEDLAELSTKTQIVGDTDAETANQFLLSMDAAYQYKGSVEQLSRVLDGANEIDNKYATSIEKIAEGLGKVAPVAAQAHVTEAELTAAIGTITAVTQRSGTEAATALRALMLNIIGDTKTEIDEGVTWTTGEIAGLTDIIKKYAPEAYKAAEATGAVIDPMEAIGGLAKAMQEGFLTEQELMEQVSDIGGKLRTSQLLALIQNWDMYQSMLEDYGNSVGSADKEVENALDSWTRKSEILKNTWTEFISKSVDSEFFKGLLDGATAAVDFADNLWLVAGAVGGVTAAVKILTNAKKLAAAAARAEEAAEKGLITQLEKEEAVRKASSAAANKWLSVAGLVVTGISVAVMAYKQYQQAQEEERQARLESAQADLSRVQSLQDLREEYIQTMDSEQSAEEKSAALDGIKKQLVETYGMESDAIDLVNGKREDMLALIDAEISKDASRAWANVADGYNDATAAMEEAANKERFIFERSVDNADGRYDTLINGLRELGFEIQALENADGTTAVKISSLAGAFESTEEAANAYANAIAFVYQQINSGDLDPHIMDVLLANFQAEFGEINGVIDDNKETIESGGLALFEYAKSLNQAGIEAVKSAESDEEATAAKERLRQALYEVVEAQGTNNLAVDTAKTYIDLLIDSLSGMDDVLNESSDGLEDQTSNLDKYRESLDGATAAIAAYKTAAEGGEKGDVFSQYADVYKDFLEHFEAGEFGSVSYQAAVKALLPEDLLRQLGYDYEEAGKLLASDFWQAVFAEGGEDHGQNFINALYEMGDGAEELGVHFQELGDGTLNVVIDDFGKLADGLGVSRDLILAVADALGIFGMYIPQTREDLLQFAQDLGAVASSSQGFRVNLQKLTEEMVSAGYSDADILSIVDSLRAIEGITLSEPKEGMQSLIDSARDAEAALSNVSDEEAEPSVDLDTTGFDTAYESLKARLDALGSTNVVVKVLAAHAAASGTDSAAGGPTLVNEEGPELIQEGDTARIAGGGKPTVTDLEPGARVYTAEETQDILHGRAISGDIPAKQYGDTVDHLPNRGGGYNVPLGASTGSGKSASSASSGNSGNTSSGSSGSSGDDEQLDTLKKIVSLRESELDLLEAQGAPTDRQAQKIAEIRAALMDEIRYMESIGGDQEEINKLTAKWYEWNDDIRDLQEGAQLDALKKTVSLRESELDLLKAQGASTRQQIDKIREIQDATLAQLRYMEAIGAEQEEINKLTKEWYGWNDEILSIQSDIWGRLEDAVDRVLEQEQAKRDDRLAELDAEIEAIRAAGEEQDKALELEEKRLAVEKARAELTEAEQERTVRYFNASTGQWEWGPNVSSVRSAREALESAEKALRDYEAELAQEAAIAEIEAQKEAVNAAYDTLEQKWNAVLESLEEPAMEISDVLREIGESATPEMAAQIQTVNALLAELGYSIQAVNRTAQQSDAPEKQPGTTSPAGMGTASAGAPGSATSSGGAQGNLDSVALDVIRGKYGNGAARVSALTAAGYDYEAVQARVNEMMRSGVYDGGGVLRGLGGIKATERDEIILPPDLTEKMLAPTSGAMVRERLAELGWMYGVERAPSSSAGFIGRDTIGTQQNYAGDIYQIGGITLTEQQARNTTLYELVQLSQNLRIYNRQM